MNKALADKWIYRYANNKEALWRKLVCVRSKGNEYSLLPALGNEGFKLVLMCFVELAIGKRGRTREVVE